MSKITSRIEKLETDMSNKAEKQTVEELQAKVNHLTETKTTQKKKGLKRRYQGWSERS